MIHYRSARQIQFPTITKRTPHRFRADARTGLALGITLGPNGRLKVPFSRFAPGRVDIELLKESRAGLVGQRTNYGFVLPGHKGLVTLFDDTKKATPFLDSKIEAGIFNFLLTLNGHDTKASGGQHFEEKAQAAVQSAQLDHNLGIWGMRRTSVQPIGDYPANEFFTLFCKSDRSRSKLLQTSISIFTDSHGMRLAEWTMGLGAINYGTTQTMPAQIQPTGGFDVNTVIHWYENNQGAIQHTLKTSPSEEDPYEKGPKLLRLMVTHASYGLTTNSVRYSEFFHRLRVIQNRAERIVDPEQKNEFCLNEIAHAFMHWFAKTEELYGNEEVTITIKSMGQNAVTIPLEHKSMLPKDAHSGIEEVIVRVGPVNIKLDLNKGKLYFLQALTDTNTDTPIRQNEMHPFLWETLDMAAQQYNTHYTAAPEDR